MSTSKAPKKETPEPEPVKKKAAAKKAAGTKPTTPRPPRNRNKKAADNEVEARANMEAMSSIPAIKAAAQRVAETETVIAPADTVVTTTEPEVQYEKPKIEELREEYGVKQDIPHQIGEEIKDRATGVWTKVKDWWNKWWWVPIAAITLTAVTFGYLYFNKVKDSRSVQDAQKTAQQKSQLKRFIDSTHAQILTLETLIYEQRKASDKNHESWMDFQQKRKAVVDYYLNENRHLHEKIDSTNDPDDVRALIDSLFTIPE